MILNQAKNNAYESKKRSIRINYGFKKGAKRVSCQKNVQEMTSVSHFFFLNIKEMKIEHYTVYHMQTRYFYCKNSGDVKLKNIWIKKTSREDEKKKGHVNWLTCQTAFLTLYSFI